MYHTVEVNLEPVKPHHDIARIKSGPVFVQEARKIAGNLTNKGVVTVIKALAASVTQSRCQLAYSTHSTNL